MNSEMFQILTANAAVQQFLGSPVRVYPWSRAPQNCPRPYAVYSVITALPENYLGNLPDLDRKTVQINVYATTGENLEDCFRVIRDALEPHAHMTSYATSALDVDTDLYSCRMDFDFLENR